MKPAHGMYHPGVDGLRAVAVLAVLFFHLDNRFIPAGFIGVDIFFVISGFVVAHSAASLPTGGLREFITSFYARRIVRIGPALVACLLVTTLLCGLFIPSAWLSEHNRQTAVAAFFGISNLVLSSGANDYFAPRAEFNPFTHTWSLGVEEQFYLLFPLIYFVWASARTTARRHLALAALAALSVASMAICAWWASAAATKAFYLLPARFWELGAGVGLLLTSGLWVERLRAMHKTSVQGFGAALAVLLGVCLWRADSSAFPFPWALPVVLATLGLIALAVSRPDVLTSKVLSSRFMVAIGLVSYSLYLWHWPVFVLFRWTTGIESVSQKAAALALSAGLAAASYHFVERPVRHAYWVRTLPRARAVAGGLALATVAAVLSLSLFLAQRSYSLSTVTRSTDWDIHRISLPAETSLPCKVAVRTETLAGVSMTVLAPQDCPAPDGGTMFVAGDSHAGAYYAMLRLYVQATGRPVRLVTQGGCAVFDLKNPIAGGSENCRKALPGTMAMLDKHMKPGDVLLLPALRVDRVVDQWGPVAAAPAPVNRVAALEEASRHVKRWEERGVHVVLEAPKPVFELPPFRCADWFNASNPICRARREVAREAMEARRAPVLLGMRQISLHTGASIWDPAATLCNDLICPAAVNGRPLFFDADHLSGYGNTVLWPAFHQFLCRVEADQSSCRPLP
jgi:peptidoglycan/LPS O-acetylase OafA/YrhL